MLETAIRNRCTQDEIPQNLIVISDMEFNHCASYSYSSYNSYGRTSGVPATLFETMKERWRAHGYEMPKLTFWNVDARQNNIPMKDDGNVRYVSGMSPVIFEQVMKDLTAVDLMLQKLDSERYAVIH